MKEEALKYLKQGYSIIPVGLDKKPLTDWLEYQKKIPTEEQIDFWWKFYPEAQIGVITGKISGIAVIDVEFEGIGKTPLLPATFTVRTGGGGNHYYYKWQEGIGNRTRVLPFLDVRGEGGFVVAPPSQTTKGKYEIVEDLPLADFPMWILGEKKHTDWEEITDGVGKGQRNDTAAVLAGKLMKALPPEEWRKSVYPFMKWWNEKCDPPLPEWELKTIFSSIADRAKQNNWTEEILSEEGRIVYAEDKRKEIEEQKKNIPKFLAKSGIPTLDETLGGFKKGWLVVFSGPPKHGKTSMCQTLTKSFINQGIKCCWFSYEMPYDELFEKFPMEKMDFYLPNYLENGNLEWIEKRIEESMRKFGTEVIFIDNLDFLQDHRVLKQVNLNLTSYVGGIVERLKSLARSKNIIIVLLCHIVKAEWISKDLPTSQDLADTRKIAQLADIVLMIMRKRAKRISDEVYDGCRAVMGIVENRHNGKTKKINLILKDNEFIEEVNYQEPVNKEAW